MQVFYICYVLEQQSLYSTTAIAVSSVFLYSQQGKNDNRML